MSYSGTQATGGLGTLLSVEMGSPLAFAVIGEVTSNIDTPTPDKPTYDATNAQSTSREKVPSRLPDNQDVNYECNYVPSDDAQQLVINDSISATTTLRNFKIEHFEDDGTTAMSEFTFSGYFKGGHVTAPVDGLKKLAFTVTVSGEQNVNFD
jgi:hypothetical protein